MTRRSLLASGAAASVYPCAVQAGEQSLELTLALDQSSSMSSNWTTMPDGEHTRHDIIQARGHANALRSPEISEALVNRNVYLRVIAWAGSIQHIKILFEGTIWSMEAVQETANLIEQHRAPPTGGTEHWVPIEYVHGQPQRGEERIIDIVTDGQLIDVDRIAQARKAFETNGGTVNVLVVGSVGSHFPNLKEVLCSPWGIYLEAKTWADFPAMIKRKLRLELGLM